MTKIEMFIAKGVLALGCFAIILAVAFCVKNNTVQYKLHQVVITKQDVVRYCLDRLYGGNQKDVDWACRDMGGYEYIVKGIEPNYDRYPSWKLWGMKKQPEIPWLLKPNYQCGPEYRGDQQSCLDQKP